jgi:hypothetical protein
MGPKASLDKDPGYIQYVNDCSQERRSIEGLFLYVVLIQRTSFTSMRQ